MSDLNQTLGQDVATTVSGDLMTSDGVELGKQRVLRRLMTNPGDYIFHPTYGAGLPKLIGQAVEASKVRALIRGQMLLEETVSKSPEPEITVRELQNGLQCSIRYTDAGTGQPVGLNFSVTK